MLAVVSIPLSLSHRLAHRNNFLTEISTSSRGNYGNHTDGTCVECQRIAHTVERRTCGLVVGVSVQMVLTLLRLAIGAWSVNVHEAQPAQDIPLGTGV
ncbi:MAG: hypothetical protein ACXW39_07435 [Nitrospira sp.]